MIHTYCRHNEVKPITIGRENIFESDQFEFRDGYDKVMKITDISMENEFLVRTEVEWLMIRFRTDFCVISFPVVIQKTSVRLLLSVITINIL
jgi:hypothetical protein